MNILVLSDHGFGVPGGAERYSSTLRDQLRRLNLNVITASIVSKGSQIKLGTRQGILRCFQNSVLTKGLNTLVDRFDVEIVHANILDPPHVLPFLNLERKLKVPYIATAHSYIHLCPTEYFVKLPEVVPCKSPYPNRHCSRCVMSKTKLQLRSLRDIPVPLARMVYNMHMFRLFLRRADCVISPSKIFTAMLWKVGISSIYMPHPLDVDKFEPTPEGDGSVVFVGRLGWEKGVQVLVKLAEMLSRYTVHIAGKGDCESWILEHKPSNVVYHGFVSESEKMNLMKRASVVVVPSLWCDMFTYVVSEALSSAKPVVAFNLGGPKEQIEESGGGLLVKTFDIKDFASKVTYLLENPDEAKKRGLRGRKWAEKHLDPCRYVQTLTSLYHLAIEK